MSSIKIALAATAALALGAGHAHAAVIPGLFNTGTDANNVALAGGNGVIDPHYQIVASTSPGFVGQQAVTFQCCYPADDADSRWVSLSQIGSPGSNTTIYRLSFDLTGLNAATAEVTGSFATDNSGDILLNGALVPGIVSNTFVAFTSFAIADGFVTGINTLDFRITDVGAPTAFRVDNLRGSADVGGGVGAIPEPATWAMMLLGFFGLGSALRARRPTPRAA